MPSVGSLRVLVTGSSGVVGTAVAEALLEAGASVVGADRRPNRWSEAVDERTREVDLLRRDDVDDLPGDVDAVVHMAARSRVMDSLEEPRQGLENLRTTFEVLDWARRREVPRVLFASSREVYGGVPSGRAVEDAVGPGDVENPYGASKVGGEALLQAWGKAFGVDAAALRLTNVYGRYDLDRVIPLFVARAWDGRDLVVYGGEDKVLDFVHVDDVERAFLAALEDFQAAAGGAYNVGSGEPLQLLDVAERIAAASPEDVDVRSGPGREGEVTRFAADVGRAGDVLGWRPEVGIGEGLEDAVDWYTSRPDVLEEILA